MVDTDAESSFSDRTSPAPEENAPRSTAPDLPLIPVGMSRLLAFAACAGLIAGVGSLLAGEMILNHYQSDLLPALKSTPSAGDLIRLKAARHSSATLAFTAMGGLFGLALGLAGGLVRRSAFASARAGILGLALGTAVAAAVAFFLVAIFFNNYDPQSGDLGLPILTHGAIWSAVGAIGGLAFGLGLGGRGRWKSTLMGGLLGAAAATIVYEIVGALIFPSSKTDLPLSTSITTRCMAQILVAIFSAVGAVLALSQAKRAPASPVSS
jgi:hypothetical protein